MATKTRDYDSTVARIAGNIAAGFVGTYGLYVLENEEATRLRIAAMTVALARQIVADVRLSEQQVED